MTVTLLGLLGKLSQLRVEDSNQRSYHVKKPDRCHPQGGGTRRQGRRDVQEARRERANLLQMEKPVLGHGVLAPGAAARTARRERSAQTHVRGPGPDA